MREQHFSSLAAPEGDDEKSRGTSSIRKWGSEGFLKRKARDAVMCKNDIVHNQNVRGCLQCELGVVLIEQRCAEGQVVCWHLFDGASPRRPTIGDPPACISGGSRCLKISGRKVVCELLLAGRLHDFLFTHFFDDRFDEFGDCQKRTAVVAFRSTVFSFHDRFYRCDRDKVC